MVPPKRSLICDMLVFALENSTILINKIPKVQRLALIQSIHYKALHNKNENTSSTDKEVLEILLYNFQTTPYLSNTDFYDAVAESMQLISSSSSYIDNETAIAIEQMIRDENWDELVSYTNAPNFTYNQALDSGELQRIRSNDDQRLLGFREMVQSIISTSKVLTKMKPSKRKRLEKSIQHATTVEDVLEKVTIFLGKSNIFKQETDVKKIKDLIAVGRFDLLLLPGCFDCDDKERLQEQNRHGSIENHNDEECIDEEEYCVICLEDMNHSFGTTTLECNHRFCTNCIQSWFMNHSTCPTCRKMISGTRLRLNHRREPRPNSDVNNSSLDIIDGLVNGAWSAIQFLLALPIVLAWSAIYFLLLLLAYALEFIQAALEAALELLLPLLAILVFLKWMHVY